MTDPYLHVRCCRCGTEANRPARCWPPRGEAGDDPENPLVIVCEGCDPERAATLGIQRQQLALLERIAVALERLAGSAPEA